MAEKKYRRREDVSETDVDGEIFLVEPGSQDVFYLDLVGAGLWRLLENPLALSEAATVFRAAFPDAANETLEKDLAATLKSLKQARLVVEIK